MLKSLEARLLYSPATGGGFSEISEYEKKIQDEASWIQLDRELRASRWLVGSSTRENAETTWSSFAAELQGQSKLITNPIEHERLDRARLAVEACEKTFSQLQNYLEHNSRRLSQEDASKLATLFQPRPLSVPTSHPETPDSDESSKETKVRHGARVARIVTKMGVLDPYTIATAGLHDLADLTREKPNPNSSNSSLSSIIENKLRTSFSGTDIDIDTLLSFLADFARLDEQGKKVADSIADRLPQETGLMLGFDFSMRQMIGLENWVLQSATHKSKVFENGDGTARVIQKPPNDDKPRFKNLVGTLSRATEDTWTRGKDGKKVRVKAPHIGPRIAYLAAAVEHSYFPKQHINTKDGQTVEKTRVDEQKVALGVWFEHLPVFNALGDPARRIALEVIQRAFTPTATQKLYDVANQITDQHGGDYFEACARVYESYVRESVDEFFATCEMPVVPVSDIEWKRRVAAKRLTGDNSTLLGPNEIYLRGYVNSPEASDIAFARSRVIDIKTAASIQEKMKELATTPAKARRLKPQFDPKNFGSADYFKKLFECQHDGFRTRIVAGDVALKQLSAHMHRTIINMEFGKERSQELPHPLRPNEMVHDGNNYANSVFVLRSAEDKAKEFTETTPDGSFHFVFSPLAISNDQGMRISPIPNLEFHIISERNYRQHEIEATGTHRVGYKQRRRIAAETDRDEKSKKLLAAEVARLSNRLAAQYYQLLHDDFSTVDPNTPKRSRRKSAGGRVF